MDFDSKLFKERLTSLTHGVSQVEIANKISISPSKLSKWLNGGAVPSITDLLTLAKVYNCSIDYLLGNDHTDETNQTIKASEFCEAIVLVDKLYGLKISTDTSAAPQSEHTASIRFEADFNDISNRSENIYEAFGREAELLATVDFLDKYSKIKDAHLDNDISELVISSLLEKVDDVSFMISIQANEEYIKSQSMMT